MAVSLGGVSVLEDYPYLTKHVIGVPLAEFAPESVPREVFVIY
jgi:hypothetical protein